MTDREKVIEELDKIADEVNPWKESPPLRCDIPYPLLCDAITLLKEPEAAEPKTGHWIYLQYCANEGVYCSECHTKMFDRYPMKKKLSRFCGHCGAKMERSVKLE